MAEKDELVKIAEKKPVQRRENGQLLPGCAPINPNGRPKGKTLKEWAREFLMNKTDKEKEAWLAKIPKDVIWKMAEGNPAQDVTSAGEKVAAINIVNYGANTPAQIPAKTVPVAPAEGIR